MNLGKLHLIAFEGKRWYLSHLVSRAMAIHVRGCGVLTARPVQADPKSKKAAIESFYFINLTVQEFIAAICVSPAS